MKEVTLIETAPQKQRTLCDLGVHALAVRDYGALCLVCFKAFVKTEENAKALRGLF